MEKAPKRIFSLVFSSNVLSSTESPIIGHMGRQTLPVGSGTLSRNVGFRQCFQVRAMQASAGAEAVLSVAGHMESKNLYEVLEISPTATAKDIKTVYRKLVWEFHPDQAISPVRRQCSLNTDCRDYHRKIFKSVWIWCCKTVGRIRISSMDRGLMPGVLASEEINIMQLLFFLISILVTISILVVSSCFGILHQVSEGHDWCLLDKRCSIEEN